MKYKIPCADVAQQYQIDNLRIKDWFKQDAIVVSKIKLPDETIVELSTLTQFLVSSKLETSYAGLILAKDITNQNISFRIYDSTVEQIGTVPVPVDNSNDLLALPIYRLNIVDFLDINQVVEVSQEQLEQATTFVSGERVKDVDLDILYEDKYLTISDASSTYATLSYSNNTFARLEQYNTNNIYSSYNTLQSYITLTNTSIELNKVVNISQGANGLFFSISESQDNLTNNSHAVKMQYFRAIENAQNGAITDLDTRLDIVESALASKLNLVIKVSTNFTVTTTTGILPIQEYLTTTGIVSANRITIPLTVPNGTVVELSGQINLDTIGSGNVRMYNATKGFFVNPPPNNFSSQQQIPVLTNFKIVTTPIVTESGEVNAGDQLEFRATSTTGSFVILSTTQASFENVGLSGITSVDTNTVKAINLHSILTNDSIYGLISGYSDNTLLTTMIIGLSNHNNGLYLNSVTLNNKTQKLNSDGNTTNLQLLGQTQVQELVPQGSNTNISISGNVQMSSGGKINLPSGSGGIGTNAANQNDVNNAIGEVVLWQGKIFNVGSTVSLSQSIQNFRKIEFTLVGDKQFDAKLNTQSVRRANIVNGGLNNIALSVNQGGSTSMGTITCNFIDNTTFRIDSNSDLSSDGLAIVTIVGIK